MENNSIGDRIKELRLKNGLSQVELAKLIGVSKQNLYKYENGIITNIPSDKIEALAHVLHTTPAYLMGWGTSDTDLLIAKDDTYYYLLEAYNRNIQLDYLKKHYDILAKPEVKQIIECLASCDEEQFNMIYGLAKAFIARNEYLKSKEKDNGNS